jgi:hypothetical protein
MIIHILKAVDLSAGGLSLGPSVVEIFLQSIPIRYRCDVVDVDVSIGYPIASEVDVSIPIESLNHQLAEKLTRWQEHCRC